MEPNQKELAILNDGSYAYDLMYESNLNVLKTFAKWGELERKQDVAVNQNATEEILDLLFEDPMLWEYLARNENLNEVHVEALLHSEDVKIKRRLAQLKKLTEEQAMRLASDFDLKVKENIARWCSHEKALVKLFDSGEIKTDLFIQNKSTPLTMLTVMWKELGKASSIVWHINTPIEMIWEIWENTQLEIVLLAYCERTSSTERLECLYEKYKDLESDFGIGVLGQIAENKNTPVEILTALVESERPRISRAAKKTLKVWGVN